MGNTKMTSNLRCCGLGAVALVAITLILIWGRAFWGSAENYQAGIKQLEAQNYIKAITFFDRSLHWYTPFNPYIEKSVRNLWEIGLQAEQRGDVRLALIAIRAIRQGFYAARSFYTPGKEWIGRCNTKIASLTAKEIEEHQTGAKAPALPVKSGDAEPDIFWTLFLEIGFLGWIGSVIGFLAYALTGKSLRLRSRPAIFWGTAVIIFFSLWIVGMMRA